MLILCIQVDSRTLLGSYLCTDNAGEFVWQPGVVTQAVQQGRWLCLEDVDRAPLEVMSALAPLLERNMLFVPGRGSVEAAPGFRLWGTLTAGERAPASRLVFRYARWQHVAITAPRDADLTRIVAGKFPPLAAAADAFVAAFGVLARCRGLLAGFNRKSARYGTRRPL